MRRQKADDEDLSGMPLLKGNEEIKEEKELKIMTPNKLLIRLSMLLTQIKAETKSYKLKKEGRQMLYVLNQYNKITKKF